MSLAVRVLADGIDAHLQRRQENCPNQCGVIDSAANSCTDDACFCPTAVALGPACSQCLSTVNVTQAQIVGSAISICESEFPTLTPHTTGPAAPTQSAGQCPQCSIIDSAVEACSDDVCLCPTLIQLGPGCSSCLATVNATEAAILGSAITICKTEFTPSATAGLTTHPTPTFGPSVTAVILPSSSTNPTTTHRSAAHSMIGGLLEMRWIHLILSLLFIGGTLL